jgi:hypothetical protein
MSLTAALSLRKGQPDSISGVEITAPQHFLASWLALPNKTNFQGSKNSMTFAIA